MKNRILLGAVFMLLGIPDALGQCTTNCVVTNPAGTQRISQPAGSSLEVDGGGIGNTPNINGVRYANSFSGSDLGQKLNAASADCGSNCWIEVGTNSGTITTALTIGSNTVVHFPCGTFSIAAGHTVSNIGVKLRGSGRACTFFDVSSSTGDLFAVTGNYFELSGMTIRPQSSVVRTSGAFVHATGGVGLLRDVTITDPFRAIFLDDNSADQWQIEDVFGNSAGGNWDYFLRTYASSGTIASTTITGLLVNRATSTQSAPILVIDSRTDTFNCVACQLLSNGTGEQPAIRTIDSAAVTGFPRWVHFTNTFAECLGGGSCVDLQSVDSFGYLNGYVQQATSNIHIGTNAKNVRFIGNVIGYSTRHAVTIDPNASPNAQFIGNGYEGVASTSTEDTYDIFSIGANASHIKIDDSARIKSGLLSYKYGVNIESGTGNNIYLTNLDALNAVGTATFTTAATGTNNNFIANPNAANRVAQRIDFLQDNSAEIGVSGHRPSTILAGTSVKSPAYLTETNCSSSATPAACGSAAAGSVTVAAGVTTKVVSTTAVTANSQIILTFDASLGTKLGVTCNVSGNTAAWISGRTAGTNFTIKLQTAPTPNPACFSYQVIN
jgi:hypothetical protein